MTLNTPHVLLSPLPFTAWGTAEQLDAPASTLTEPDRPGLTARGTGRWTVDLGTATACSALALVAANFTTATVSYATDGGYSFTAIVTAQALPGVDIRTNRRGLYLPFGTLSPTTLRIDAAGLLAGETAYELGGVAVGVDRALASVPEWPVQFTPVTPASELQQPDTGRVVDINEEGRPRVALRLTMRVGMDTAALGPAAILADLQALATQPADAPFVYWDGADWPARVYVVRRSEDTTITQTPGLVTADIGLLECV